MGTAQHRHVCKLMRKIGQAASQFVQHRQHDRIATIQQHQCMTQVINILGSAGKCINSSLPAVSGCRMFFAQPVFDCLHIVIGALFNMFDLLCIGFTELLYKLVQTGDGIRGKRPDPGNGFRTSALNHSISIRTR